jgi:hypothetical protein
MVVYEIYKVNIKFALSSTHDLKYHLTLLPEVLALSSRGERSPPPSISPKKIMDGFTRHH